MLAPKKKSYNKPRHTLLKSKDITLLTKVIRVKAMVFPVVMCGCESWTVKKVEHRRIDAFKLCHMDAVQTQCKRSVSVEPTCPAQKYCL